MHGLLRLKIDNVDSIVAEFGDDEPVLLEVYRHVINPSGHGLERYCCLKDQGRAPPIHCQCSRCGTAEKGFRQKKGTAEGLHAVQGIKSPESG